MVKKFKKHVVKRLSKYFTSADFDCKCNRSTCTETLVDDALAPALDLLWDKAGPFKINSGFRCKSHNDTIGGAVNSMHLLGKAADCQSYLEKPGPVMASFAEEIEAFHNGGIGIYNTFVHCDVRETKTRWDYSNKNGPEKADRTS